MELEEGEILDTSSGHSLPGVVHRGDERYSRFVNSVNRNTHANVRSFNKTLTQNRSQPDRHPLVPTRASMNIDLRYKHSLQISNQSGSLPKKIGTTQGFQDKHFTHSNKDIQGCRSYETHSLVTQETHTLSSRKLSRREQKKRRLGINSYESYVEWWQEKREKKRQKRQRMKQAKNIASTANTSTTSQPLMTKLLAAGFAKKPVQAVPTPTNPITSKPTCPKQSFLDNGGDDCDVIDLSSPSPLSLKTEQMSSNDRSQNGDNDSDIEIIVPPKKIPLCVTLDSDGEEVEVARKVTEPRVKDKLTKVQSSASGSEIPFEQLIDSQPNQISVDRESDIVDNSLDTTPIRKDSFSSPKYPESEEFDFEIPFSPSSPSSVHSSADDKVMELESSRHDLNPANEGSPFSNSEKLTVSSVELPKDLNSFHKTSKEDFAATTKYDEFGICTTSSYLVPRVAPDKEKLSVSNATDQSQNNSLFDQSKNKLVNNDWDDSKQGTISKQNSLPCTPPLEISEECCNVIKNNELEKRLCNSVDQLSTSLRDEEAYSPNSNYGEVGKRNNSIIPSLPSSFSNTPSNSTVLSPQCFNSSKPLKQTIDISISAEEFYSPDSNYGKDSDREKDLAKSSLTSSFASTPLPSWDLISDVEGDIEGKKTPSEQCLEIINLDGTELTNCKKNKSDDEDISKLRNLALSTKGKCSQNSTPNRHQCEPKDDEFQSSTSEGVLDKDNDLLNLRVAALKSAVIKKHEERKKKGVTIKKKRQVSTSLEEDIIPLVPSEEASSVVSSFNNIDCKLPKTNDPTKSSESLIGEEDMDIDSDDDKIEVDTSATDDQVVENISNFNPTEQSSTGIITDQQMFNSSQPPPPGVDFNGSPSFFSAQSQSLTSFPGAVPLSAIPPALTFPSLIPPPPPPPMSPPNPFANKDNLNDSQTFVLENSLHENSSSQKGLTQSMPSIVASIPSTNNTSLNLESWSKSYTENSPVEQKSNNLGTENNPVKSLRPNLKRIALLQTLPYNPLSTKKLKKQRQKKKKILAKKLLEQKAKTLPLCITSGMVPNQESGNKCQPSNMPLCTIRSNKPSVTASLPNHKPNVSLTVTSPIVYPDSRDQKENPQYLKTSISTDSGATIFGSECISKASSVQDEDMDLNNMIVLDEVGMSPEHRSRLEPTCDGIEDKVIRPQAPTSVKSITQNDISMNSSKCTTYPERKEPHRNVRDRLGLQIPSSKPIQFENFSVTRKVSNIDSSKYKLSRVKKMDHMKRSVVQDSNSLKVVIPSESPPPSASMISPSSAPIVSKFIIRVDKDSDSEEESEWLRKVRIQEPAATKVSEVSQKHPENLEHSIDMLLMNAWKTVETQTSKSNPKKPIETNKNVIKPESSEESPIDFDDISDTPLQYLPKERQEEYQRLQKLLKEKLMEKKKSTQQNTSLHLRPSILSKTTNGQNVQKPEIKTSKPLTLSERLIHSNAKALGSQSSKKSIELPKISLPSKRQNKVVTSSSSTPKEKIQNESGNIAITSRNDSQAKNSTENVTNPNKTSSTSTTDTDKTVNTKELNKSAIGNKKGCQFKKQITLISPPNNETVEGKPPQNSTVTEEKRITLRKKVIGNGTNTNETQSCNVVASACVGEFVKTPSCNQMDPKEILSNKKNLLNNFPENDNHLKNIINVIAEEKKQDSDASKELAPKVLVELGDDEVQIYTPVSCNQQGEGTKPHDVEEPNVPFESEQLKIQPKELISKPCDLLDTEKLVSNQEELLCERFLLIDELTEVADSLSQLEQGQAELEQAVVEISQLRNQLQVAEQRLQAKRQSTQQLETAIYSKHQTMFMRNLKIRRLETNCQQIGKVLRGGKYETPVRGKELMTKKVHQFIKKRDTIKHRRQILNQFMENTDAPKNVFDLYIPCEILDPSSLPHPDTSRIPPFPSLQLGLNLNSSSPQSPPMCEKGLPPPVNTIACNKYVCSSWSEFLKDVSPKMGLSETPPVPDCDETNSGDCIESETHSRQDNLPQPATVKTETNEQHKEEAVRMSLDEIATLTKSFIELSEKLEQKTGSEAIMSMESVEKPSYACVSDQQCGNSTDNTPTHNSPRDGAGSNTKEYVFDNSEKKGINTTLSKKRCISQTENTDVDKPETKKVLLQQQNTQSCNKKPTEIVCKDKNPCKMAIQPAKSSAPNRSKSKLQYKSIFRNKNDVRDTAADSESVLCPYDLSGRCHDPSCKFKHFPK